MMLGVAVRGSRDGAHDRRSARSGPGKLIATRGGHADEITETRVGRPPNRSKESGSGVRVANGAGH